MGLGRYFNGGNFMQVALALSLMRPDSQSYLGEGPTAAGPQISSGGPYNMTNAVFNPVTMSPSETSAITDRFWAAKEAAAAENQNPLSRFLDLHVNKNQFDNDAVAMLFEGGPPCPPPRRPLVSDSESGYNSEGALSPSASSQEPCADISEMGAAGYTPPSSTTAETSLDLNGILNLDDFLDLNPIESTVKAEPQSPAFDEGIPDLKLQPFSEYTRCTSTQDLYSDQKEGIEGIEGIDLQPSFGFDIDSLYGPSFSIDPANDAQQFTNDGTDLDGLDFDFAFPPDILSPIGAEDNPEEEDLLSQVLTGTPEMYSRTGSPAHSEYSVEESLPSLPDSSFLYTPSATDTRVLKVEPNEVPELQRLPTDLPTKGIKGARPKVSVSRLSRLPISDSRLIELPVNDFNELVSKLNEEGAQYARDIRRRGKNKEAARLCRKRKIEAIGGLDEELMKLNEEKAKIMEERHTLQEETLFWKNKLAELEGYVFKSLRDDNGRPLSPREYSLFQGSNGNVYVGKDINAKRPKKK